MAPMVPLGDIIGTRLVKQIKINYGKVRLWGSVSFIVGSTVVGWSIEVFSHESILWLIIFAVFCNYLLSLIKLTPQLQEQKKTTQQTGQNLFSLIKQPNVIYFILAMGLIQGSHAAYYSFSALYWHAVGISEFNVALLWGSAVAAEVLLMRFNDKLFGNWSIKQMCLLAVVAGIIRWAVLSQTTNLALLMFVQTFHAFTFALAHLAAMRFIAMQKDYLMVSYQTVYSGVALGLIMAMLTFISGWLYANLAGQVFLIMALVLLPAIFFIYKLKYD